MLSIGKLGAGQETYYLEKVAEGAEDYYSGEGEAAGKWMGAASAELGLAGEVGGDQLTAMLTGRSPLDGNPLGLRAVGGRGPVPGFDLTFSAPKSVSLLWGLGDSATSAEVRAAHTASVEAALGYLQREACWTRRGAGGAEFVKGNGYLAAAYRHRSSRNGDPQLHTHVLIANATKGPDGRWSRLYHPAIYDHAKTASYIYEANLRHELSQRLGVRWQEVRKGIAEIEGFADEHLRAFSTRRAEILAAVGPDASARSMQVAALATRQSKERDLDGVKLTERWRTRAEAIGLDRETIERTCAELGQAPALPTTAEIEEKVTAHAAHFDRREAIQAVADSMPHGAPAKEVERIADAFLASESVVAVSIGPKGERFTTKRMWELEAEALSSAERMRSEPRGEVPAALAERVLAARPTLKDDQRRMVASLLSGEEGISVVIGEAGTGKTFAIVAAAEGWEQAGYELQALAPTWRAANELRGHGLEARSIASFLHSDDALSERSILLVDEAGMVGTRELAELIARADQAGAKLVAIGDDQQLGAIEAGGLFAELAKRTEPIRLDEVIRHNHQIDRDAAKLIREAKGTEALSLYRSAERVIVAPDAQARREAMVADWWRSYSRGEDALMVAKRNVEVERLNAAARELQRAEGRLGAEEIEIDGLRFAAGDQVLTRVNDRKAQVYNRERWQVAEVDVERRSVVLEGIDSPRRVELGADYLAKTALHGEAPALQHAYAVTTYCAQGASVDRAYVMADPSMDKQELYVAASRSREETYFYATPEIVAERDEFAPSPPSEDALGHLAQASMLDRAQTSAHEEAYRAKLREMPTEELATRRRELVRLASEEAQQVRLHEDRSQGTEAATEDYRRAVERREAVEGMGRRERRRELPKALEREDMARARLRAYLDTLDRTPQPAGTAKQEAAIVAQELAARTKAPITAAQLAPPGYVLAELGERPTDPKKLKAWERGVSAIEGYRQEHGVKDPKHALGKEHHDGRELARARLRQAQRDLDMKRTQQRSMERGRDMGMDIGL